MAAMLELSAEEAAMNGAPEGELYVANVIEREEVAEPEDAASLLADLEEELGSIAKAPWHEQFTFADRCRQIIIHSTGSITSQFADGLTVALVLMGGASRSVLAHNGIITLGELLVLCPDAMSNKKTLTLAMDLLMDLCKKNKPRVIRDRVESILKEITDGYFESDAEVESNLMLNELVLVPVLASKHTGHLDLLVMVQAANFLERTAPKLIENNIFPDNMKEKSMTGMLTGLANLLKSKAADAKSSAKRTCGIFDECLRENGSEFKSFVKSKGLPTAVNSELTKVTIAKSAVKKPETLSKEKKKELMEAKRAHQAAKAARQAQEEEEEQETY